MKPKSDQFALICVTLVLTAAISWFFYFKQAVAHDTVDINQFPKSFGTWTSKDLPLTKDEFAILETHNAFVRLYTNSADNSRVYLYLVYSQDNRKVAHPPEICYTGSGLSVTESAHDSIHVSYKDMTIQANRLQIGRGRFSQVVYYWFKVGDRFTSNYWKQQALIALDTLLGRHASSALVRVSTDIENHDLNAGIARIKKFADMIAQDLFYYMP